MDRPRPQITLRIEEAFDAFMEWWGRWGLLIRLGAIFGILLFWSGSAHPRDFLMWIVLPTVALIAVSMLRFRDERRFTRNLALNLCPHCGYDLRATPDRCPECGNAVHVLPVVRETLYEHRNRKL